MQLSELICSCGQPTHLLDGQAPRSPHRRIGDTAEAGEGQGRICSQNSGKIFFSGKYRVKFGHFVNFSGKNVLPLKFTELRL